MIMMMIIIVMIVMIMKMIMIIIIMIVMMTINMNNLSPVGAEKTGRRGKNRSGCNAAHFCSFIYFDHCKGGIRKVDPILTNHLQNVGALGLLLPGHVHPRRAGSSPLGSSEAASKCWI